MTAATAAAANRDVARSPTAPPVGEGGCRGGHRGRAAVAGPRASDVRGPRGGTGKRGRGVATARPRTSAACQPRVPGRIPLCPVGARSHAEAPVWCITCAASCATSERAVAGHRAFRWLCEGGGVGERRGLAGAKKNPCQARLAPDPQRVTIEIDWSKVTQVLRADPPAHPYQLPPPHSAPTFSIQQRPGPALSHPTYRLCTLARKWVAGSMPCRV